MINHNLTKFVTTKNIIITALVIVILYMHFHKGKNPDKPIVKTIKEQMTPVIHDSVLSQHIKDSVQLIINKWQDEAGKWQSSWKQLAGQYSSLENGMNDLLTQEVPDTCKALQSRMLAQFNKIIEVNRQKDTASVRALAAKDSALSQKDTLIKQHKLDYSKLRINLDTCFAQQTKLQKYVDKFNPKNEIYIGANTSADKQLKFGYGISLGWRGKKGTMVEVGIVQIGPATNYTLSIKKPLFKF